MYKVPVPPIATEWIKSKTVGDTVTRVPFGRNIASLKKEDVRIAATLPNLTTQSIVEYSTTVSYPDGIPPVEASVAEIAKP
jgi:hypothetical protein